MSIYSTFDQHNIDEFSLVEIVHFLIGVLNKFKSKDNREIDLRTIPYAPKGENYVITDKFLKEINAVELIDNQQELNIDVNNLYTYLSDRLVVDNPMNRKNALRLLKKWRS